MIPLDKGLWKNEAECQGGIDTDDTQRWLLWPHCQDSDRMAEERASEVLVHQHRNLHIGVSLVAGTVSR